MHNACLRVMTANPAYQRSHTTCPQCLEKLEQWGAKEMRYSCSCGSDMGMLQPWPVVDGEALIILCVACDKQVDQHWFCTACQGPPPSVYCSEDDLFPCCGGCYKATVVDPRELLAFPDVSHV
jgi:hypothetical protein